MKKALLLFLLIHLMLPAGRDPACAENAEAPPVYTLQHMTILDRFTADAELQKMRKQGYEAYLVEYTTHTGKIIYKLRSGKYPTRAAAVAAADMYSEKDGASVMIVTSREAGETPRSAVSPPGETSGKRGVRISVTAGDNSSRPDTLQEKVNALKRGDIPRSKRTQKADDDIWFTVQTSTEPVKRAAERRINKLRDKGYDAYCIESVQNGRTLYKIRFGKFASADEASRAAENYSSSERRKCMVVKMAAGKDIELPQPAPSPARDQQENTAAKQRTAALQAPASQPQEEPEEPDAAAEKPAAPAQPPTDAEQPPPEQDEQEPDEAVEQEGEGEQQPDAPAEPERVSKIYAYREKSGALNLTNRYEDIPEPLRTSIDYISLFPVRIKNLPKTGAVLTLDVLGEKKEIILGGVTFPKQGDAALAYLEALQNKPLRLKYNPWLQGKDGPIAGRLYRKEGSYINLDMVRKGIGQFDAATLAPDQQEAFRQAQEAARRDQAGIWK